MLKELTIGFDCREMWMPEAEVKNWKDKSQLLNPNVERILSINRGWRSVFLPPEGKYSQNADRYTSPGYKLAIPYEWTTINLFWRDLEAMREFMLRHKKEYQKRCWMIGITVLPTPEYLHGLADHMVPPTIDNREPDRSWTLLGYDVEDNPFFSGGLGMSWIEEYEEERRKLWGYRLNQYYLFSRQDDAIEYAGWHVTVNPGIGTLLVFGLYLIQEFP